jgi:uncharacterized membrane protein YqjE
MRRTRAAWNDLTDPPDMDQPGRSAPVAITRSDEAAEPSIGELVQQASTQLSAMVHGEIELAKLELRSSVKNAGVGVGFFSGAGVLFVFSLTFGLIALAEGLVAAGIWRWAAYLIVFGLLLVLVAVLVLLGRNKVRRVKAPERTIAVSKETVAYLKQHEHA